MPLTLFVHIKGQMGTKQLMDMKEINKLLLSTEVIFVVLLVIYWLWLRVNCFLFYVPTCGTPCHAWLSELADNTNTNLRKVKKLMLPVSDLGTLLNLMLVQNLVQKS